MQENASNLTYFQKKSIGQNPVSAEGTAELQEENRGSLLYG